MSLRCTLLIIQEHIDIFDAVLEDTTAPFNFIEKKLTLEAASDLESSSPVISRYSVIDQQLALDL
jgi:hypothetical protein